jgi:hypothetical protein
MKNDLVLNAPILNAQNSKLSGKDGTYRGKILILNIRHQKKTNKYLAVE